MEKETLKYLDCVEITAGFYSGNRGRLVGDGYVTYQIRLEDGYICNINKCKVEKIT